MLELLGLVTKNDSIRTLFIPKRNKKKPKTIITKHLETYFADLILFLLSFLLELVELLLRLVELLLCLVELLLSSAQFLLLVLAGRSLTSCFSRLFLNQLEENMEDAVPRN